MLWDPSLKHMVAIFTERWGSTRERGVGGEGGKRILGGLVDGEENGEKGLKVIYFQEAGVCFPSKWKLF